MEYGYVLFRGIATMWSHEFLTLSYRNKVQYILLVFRTLSATFMAENPRKYAASAIMPARKLGGNLRNFRRTSADFQSHRTRQRLRSLNVSYHVSLWSCQKENSSTTVTISMNSAHCTAMHTVQGAWERRTVFRFREGRSGGVACQLWIHNNTAWTLSNGSRHLCFF